MINAKIGLKNCNKSFTTVEQSLQLHQSFQNIAYFQKYLLFSLYNQ